MKKIIYICDYCGKECDDTEFVIPEWVQEDVRDNIGVTITYVTRCKTSHKHICKHCQGKIAAAITWAVDFGMVHRT